MLRRLSGRELTEWQAYYRLDPWGGGRDDANAAMIASCVVNMLRARGPAVSPADLMPKWGGGEERPRQTPEEMMLIMRSYTRACGGTVNGKRGG